ncbi:glycosyl hydrolase [Streptomyces sp. NPDC005799]|uniref:glycosyl hydrolase n=1 Tax=Streptomyces sp. NPDC005799 TaxID=3154678 RepID=UPI00341170E9
MSAAIVVPIGGATPAAAANWWTCPAGGNPNAWDPRYTSVAGTAGVWWRKIELRYHRGTRCAWGHIANGSPGDAVWVDWSANRGQTWKQLDVTRIPRGRRETYTVAHNDAGYVMRACGKAGNRAEIACTRWY